MSIYDLIAAMRAKTPVQLNGKVGRICSVKAEDGSGYRWIISIITDSGMMAVYFQER